MFSEVAPLVDASVPDDMPALGGMSVLSDASVLSKAPPLVDPAM